MTKNRAEREAKFKAGWLEHQDSQRAYLESFPPRKDLSRAAAMEMARPYMQEALNAFARKSQAAIEIMASREEQALAIAPTPVHWLEARINRILLLSRIADGTEVYTKTEFTETGEEYETIVYPSFKDRVAALKLLGQTYGDHTTKVEVKDTTERPHFVYVENGLGPSRQEASTEMELCSKCETIVTKGGHECKKLLTS